MRLTIRRCLAALPLLFAAGAALAIDMPAATVSLSSNGTSNALPVDSTQGLPLSIMLSAPSGGTLEVDGAPTSGGPWQPVAIVVTSAGSNTFNSTTNTMSTTWPGYSFSLPYLVPYLRLTASGLAGQAVIGVAQPVIHQ